MCPISVRPSNLFVSVYVTFFFLEINVKEYRKGGKSRESGNIRYTRRQQTNKKHNTICVRHHYTQVNTNNVNRTRTLLKTNGGKDEPNIYFFRKTVF